MSLSESSVDDKFAISYLCFLNSLVCANLLLLSGVCLNLEGVSKMNWVLGPFFFKIYSLGTGYLINLSKPIGNFSFASEDCRFIC